MHFMRRTFFGSRESGTSTDASPRPSTNATSANLKDSVSQGSRSSTPASHDRRGKSLDIRTTRVFGKGSDSSTNTEASSDARLKRSTSTSSTSRKSQGQKEKQRNGALPESSTKSESTTQENVLGGLWKRFTGTAPLLKPEPPLSAASSPASSPTKSKVAKAEMSKEEHPPNVGNQRGPQLLYFFGSRTPAYFPGLSDHSSLISDPTSTSTPQSSESTPNASTASTDLTPPPRNAPGGGHAKFLSVVAEGEEDETERKSAHFAASPATSASSVPLSRYTDPYASSEGVYTAGLSPYINPATLWPVGQDPTTARSEVDPLAPEQRQLQEQQRLLDAYGQNQLVEQQRRLSLGSPELPDAGWSDVAQTPVDLANPFTLAYKIQELVDALPAPEVWEHPDDDEGQDPLATPRPAVPGTPIPHTPNFHFRPRRGGMPDSPLPRHNPITRLPRPPPARTPKRDPKTQMPLMPKDAVPVLEDGLPVNEVEGEVVEVLKKRSYMTGAVGQEERDQERRRREGPVAGQVSVWDVLESLDVTGHIPATPYTPGRSLPGGWETGGWGEDGSVPLPPVEEEQTDTPAQGMHDEATLNNLLFSPGGSIMLYAPLLPTDGDKVEMGDVVSVMVEEDVPSGYIDLPASPVPSTHTVATSSDDAQPASSFAATATAWIPRPNVWQWFGGASNTDPASPEHGSTTVPGAFPAARVASPRVTYAPLIASPRMGRSPLLNARHLRSPARGSFSPTVRNRIASPRMGYHRSPQAQARSLAATPLPGAQLMDTITAYTSPDGRQRLVRIREEKAWAPSTEKISFQVFWWGYRMYLPPPALAILSDKKVEAVKRAAMITTALTWFLNNVPVAALPLPLQPTVLLLQRVAPYLGYIGTFISWSWQQIKSYDVGKGVILSATWLLPVALIPGTWWEHSFPTSPPPPAQPLPLPGPTPPKEIPTTKPVPAKPSPVPVPPSETETNAPTESLPSSPEPLTPRPVALPQGRSPTAVGLWLSKVASASRVSLTASDGAHTASSGAPQDEDNEGAGGRKRKTSLSATIASFVARKALVKGPSGASVPSSSTSATAVPSSSHTAASRYSTDVHNSPASSMYATPVASPASAAPRTFASTARQLTPGPGAPIPPIPPMPLEGSPVPPPPSTPYSYSSGNTAHAVPLPPLAPRSGQRAGVHPMVAQVQQGAVNPESRLGQELVMSWRMDPVPLP